ncbi:MAG: transposase [Actinobacteria bacterium]|nr:transposase [Actinomycetota bacterium]
MAYDYKVPRRDQLFLLPPSIAEWLPEHHLVWFVLDVVAMVDLSAFHARHPNDGAGRAAYDPEMMLALLVYAYCRGMRSSRRVEAACRADLAFRAICVDVVPDHAAIARFRAQHEEAIKATFVDVLRLCAKAGLASLGTIAIDGTKIAADAALGANRSESSISAEVDRILAEAARTDTAEATQPSLVAELPEILARPGSRLARLRAAAAEIEAERAERLAAEANKAARLAEQAASGNRPRGAAPADPTEALQRAEADVEALAVRKDKATTTLSRLGAVSALGKAQQRLELARTAAEQAPSATEAQANTTDPESRIMKTASGWVQGYNAQAAVNANQLIMAVSVTQDRNDVAQLVPMMEAVVANAQQRASRRRSAPCSATPATGRKRTPRHPGPIASSPPQRTGSSAKRHERWVRPPVRPPRGPARSKRWSTDCAPPREPLPTPSAPPRSSRSSGKPRRPVACGGS